MIGAELALDSLNVLGLIVADEIAETRIGMVQGVERRPGGNKTWAGWEDGGA